MIPVLPAKPSSLTWHVKMIGFICYHLSFNLEYSWMHKKVRTLHMLNRKWIDLCSCCFLVLGADSKSIRARPVWLQHPYPICSLPLLILTGEGWEGGEIGGGEEGETEMLNVVCFWGNSISVFHTFECNSPQDIINN